MQMPVLRLDSLFTTRFLCTFDQILAKLRSSDLWRGKGAFKKVLLNGGKECRHRSLNLIIEFEI